MCMASNGPIGSLSGTGLHPHQAKSVPSRPDSRQKLHNQSGKDSSQQPGCESNELPGRTAIDHEKISIVLGDFAPGMLEHRVATVPGSLAAPNSSDTVSTVFSP